MKKNKPGKRIVGIALALMMAVTPFFSTHAMEVNSPPGTTEPTSQEMANDQNETNETDSSVSSDTQKEEQTEKEKTNDSVKDKDQGSEDKDAEDSKASDKNSKTIYTSKINGVEITAKLSSAEAIPDDADLKASLITKNSKEYNYDAYMKALNDGKDKEAYTEDNTLLYDLAFMKDGKELEPTEGTVSVTFDFKNDQLSEDLGAKKASDVNVIHLPLKDSVRDKFDSTKAAKSIDEDDINKEEIKDKDLNVSLSKETVKFETKDFSVFAYTVDFTHDEYTYSIAGEDSIMLSDLFKELKIDEDLDNVKDVDFSDPKLIKVTEKDSDWELKSLKPFSSEETLTVTLNNGSTIEIKVTDAQSAYTVNVEVTGYDGEDISYDGSEQFSVYAELREKNPDGTAGDIIGWNAMNLDMSNPTVTFPYFGTLDNENMIETWNPSHLLTYDSDQHVVTVRLYKNNPAPTYHNVRNPGQWDQPPVDTFDGYQVISNKASDSSPLTTIVLQKAYVKQVDIDLTFEPEISTEITAEDNYYVLVEVEHATTGTTYFLKKIVTEGNNTQRITVDKWYDSNGNELPNEKFTGNEQGVKVTILKATQELSIDSAKNRTNCKEVGTGNGDNTVKKVYTVTYDSDWEGTIPEANHIAQTHTDEYTYDITLTKIESSATSDYTFKSILGPGLYYGISAENFDQGNHIQSNFATNYYDGHNNIVEADLAGSSGAIVMSDAKDYSGKLIDIGQSHSGNVLLYTNGDEDCLKNPRDFVTVITKDEEELKDNFVDPIINYGTNISNELKTHAPTISDAVVSDSVDGGKLNLDTTEYGDDATIYINGDDIKDYLHDGKLKLTKKPGQVIVFNFTNTESLKLGEFYVRYPDMSKYEAQGILTNDGYIKSDTPTTKGDKNDAIDELAQHIVWNCNSVTDLELGMTTGMYLVPNVESYTNTAATSSGWIITGGTFHNSGGEWHSVYSELPDVDKANLHAKKTVDGKTPTAGQVFEFKIEQYDPENNTWVLLHTVNNNGGAISHSVENLNDGWNIYRITETKKADSTEGNYTIDTIEFFAAVDYQTFGSGGSTMKVASLPRYFMGFDTTKFDSESTKTMEEIGLSQPVTELPPTFVNNTTTDRTGDLELSKTLVSNVAADTDQEFTFTVRLSDETISGTYGDMTFTGGVATVKLKGGQKATATKLPAGITYTITEAEAEGFALTSKIGDTGTISTTKATASFTNTRETGDLELSKTVVSDIAADQNQEFTFTVTLGDRTISGEYGGMTFENGVATVRLTGGENATAEGLPTGITYTITEADAEGFTLTSKTGDEGTISTTKSEASFTNTRDTGDLELSKILVSDAAADADQEFTFTVKLSDETISGEYGDMTFTGGVATVKLKGGEDATAEGLPTGITYTITEAAATGFQQTGKTGDTGTISTTKSEAKFTNTREKGNLNVSKTVNSSTASDKEKNFNFTVTLSDTTINGEFGGMTFTDGVATFTLKDSETKTAEGLPTGIRYTVEEETYEGFVLTKSGDTGAITTTPATATFTNTKKEGGLTVIKSVTSASASDKTKDFTFTVTLDDKTINGEYGGMTFTNGVATFKLKDGESCAATGLPNGVGYTVTEAADGSMTTESTGATGTIQEQTPAVAEFANTRKTGELELSKILVSDAAADADQEFTFTVTLDDESIAGKFGDMTFSGGVATVTLKGGQKATATKLPIGVSYTITEADAPGFEVTQKTGETGTISKTKSEASFTNTREKGDLELSKTVVSDAAADANQKFTFTVTLSDKTISRKYGDMDFTEGVATVELKGGEKAAATGLPTGITYTITEADAEGFQLTGKTGDTGTISTTKSEATFTNTREKGDLNLKKTLFSDAAADAAQEFTFTVTLGDTTISGTYGDMTFAAGVATVKLKGGENATATGLPTGVTYTITEANAPGFQVTKKTGNEGTISKDLSEAEFTNTRDTGDLEVTKTVTSSTASDKTKDFSFTVTLSDAGINGEYGDMTFTAGVATFTLKDNETKKAEGLPTGITYEVKEVTPAGFVVTKSGDTGEITTNTAEAKFTNTKEEGGLVVSKSVTSAVASDKDKDYSFTVTLGDKTITGTYGEMTFENGEATFTLKDGASKAASGLPKGIKYTVKETAEDNMTTTSTGETGTIPDGKTPVKAEFVNTRDTGDLELSKTVVSDAAADADKEFTFTVTLNDNSIAGTFGDMFFEKGVATVTLKGGQSATAVGLPVGVGYTITEAQADGFTLTKKIGDEGTISKTASKAEFTNTRKTGDLNLKKTLISKRAADANQKFTFTVELSDKSISGTYGDMKFKAGVATVELKGGEEATATGLPTGITYTITEAAATGFEQTGVTGASGAITETAAQAEFTNTRDTGDLEVSKTVTSSTASDKTKDFEFTVTLSDTTINGEFGQMTFKDGVATFKLKDKDSKTATGLPTDIEYTVTEETYDGFIVTKSGDTGEIKPDPEVSKAKFTNAKKEGGLIVTKSVTSSEASDKTRAYEFTVTLGDTTINGKYGDMTFENGVATFELKDTETAEAKGLPEGVKYTVVEKTYNNMTTTKTGDTGKIPEGDEPAVAAFVNTRNTGDLELSKTVVSDAAADANQKFTFTVTMNDETFSGTYGDMTFENGVATVELKGGEKATATGLPAGIGYRITETQVDGFTMTGHPGDSGTITEKTSQAVFTNTRDTGELVLSKTLISDRAADADQIFEFTVTLSDPTINSGIFNAITKTYGGMNFKDGVAKVKLQGGQQVKAENLPTGLTYTITEESAPGFVQTGKTGDTGTISTTQSTATFENTRETGDLTVSKTLISDAAADKDQKFTFTVTLDDKSISDEYGDMTFTNGVATVELKGGESATAEDLPTGVKYTVTETNAAGFEMSAVTGDSGEISTKQSTAVFTNTRKTGDLEVSKTVISSTASDKTKNFDFTVTLSDKTINGTYGGMTFTDGVATFKLKDSEKKTATGLPTGIGYTVTETDPDGFTVTKTGDTGQITTTKSEAQFTNSKEEGGLIVTKSVVSTVPSDTTKEYSFTVTLDDKTVSGTYGDMTFENGVATFKLKSGQTKSATGLAKGIGYTVTEEACANMTTTSKGETDTITGDKEPKKAAFVNTRDTGELVLSKKLISDAAADKTRAFTFTVTLGDTSIEGVFGGMTFEEGVATVSLKGGETVTATGLPAGISYEITEADADGFTLTGKTGDSGEISTKQSKAEFKNTRDTGDLKVSKVVISDAAADADQEFTFAVVLRDATINGKYGDMTFKDGMATVNLKGGESKTATGLPTGLGYEITEDDTDGFELTGETGDTGTISKELSEAIFTNTRETGGLMLSKELISDIDADADQVFTFTVTLNDTTINSGIFDLITKTYGDMTFKDGVATVELKGGESATAENLPTGITYTITEADAPGFELTATTGDSGTISTTRSEAAFTNTRVTTSVTLGGSKAFENGDLTKNQFEFALYEKDGEEPIQTTLTDGQGNFQFAPIQYTLEDLKEGTGYAESKDIEYVIKEVVPETADENGFDAETGIQYDLTERPATVTLKQTEDGKLEATNSLGETGAQFTNEQFTKLKLTKTIDGYNAGDTEGEFTNATLVFKVTYKVDDEEIVRYMNVQYTADTGAVTTAELDKIPIDAEISVDEVYSDNYESEQTSDIELVTDEETGESYYTVSFDNTLKRIEHGSGIINKYEKDASGNFHLQYRIKDGTNPQEPK